MSIERYRGIGFLTRCLLLLPSALLLSVKYDLPHILILTMAFACIPFFLPPIAGGRKTILLSLPVILFAVIIPHYLFPVEGPRFAFVDALIRSHFCVPLLLYSAAVMCAVRRTRELNGLIALICVFCCLLCGDIFHTKQVENVRFLLSTDLLRNYRVLYTIMVLLQTAGVLLLLTSDARYATAEPRRSRKYRLAAWLLLPVCFITLDQLRDVYSDELRQMERYLQRKMRRSHHRQFTRNTREQNIARPFADFGLDRMDAILLRVYADEPPGYLRGRVYEQYRSGGVWRRSGVEPTELPDLALDAELALSYYPFYGDSLETGKRRMEIFPASGVFQGYLPVPGNTVAVEMVSDSARISPDGVLIPEKMTQHAGYFAITTQDDGFMTATQYPQEGNAESLRRYLTLPTELASLLRQYHTILFPEPEKVSPRGKTERIIQFLRKNYAYSLNPQPAAEYHWIKHKNPPSDPVERFLTYTRAGHCELFASAAVLMLRASGIHARYITGFVCTDLHPAGWYYATGRNAHAWVEAYDPESGKWIAYDPTPETWSDLLQNPVPGATDVFFARIEDFLRSNFADLFRGYPGKMVNRFFTAIAEWLVTPAGWCVMILVTASGVFLVIRYRRRRRIDLKYSRSRQQIYRAMCRLAAQLKVERKEEMSWREWSRDFAAMPFFDELADIVTEYECLRYRPAPVTQEEVTAFEDRLRTFRRRYAGSSYPKV